MSETPVPRDPGQDDDPPGVPAGPGDRPSLGSPHWQLVPQSPDWPEWMDEDAHAEDEDPGDPDEYEDPDNAPPPGLDDAELAVLLAAAREAAGDQARAAAAMGRLGHTAVLAAAGAVVSGRRGPGMPGSRPASRWMPRRAAPRWPRSWRTRPGRRTGTAAPPMMNSTG
jgi:hypothetical protein